MRRFLWLFLVLEMMRLWGLMALLYGSSKKLGAQETGHYDSYTEEYQEEEFLDWRLNNTFISLIPKVERAQSIEDHRPIALLGPIYKIDTKVLSGRLKRKSGLLFINTKMPLCFFFGGG